MTRGIEKAGVSVIAALTAVFGLLAVASGQPSGGGCTCTATPPGCDTIISCPQICCCCRAATTPPGDWSCGCQSGSICKSPTGQECQN